MEPPPLPPPGKGPPPIPAVPHLAVPEPKPVKYELGWAGGIALIVCFGLVVWANRSGLTGEGSEMAGKSAAYLAVTLLAFMVFCVAPSWLMWRITRSALVKNLVLFSALACLTIANVSLPFVRQKIADREALRELDRVALEYRNAQENGNADPAAVKPLLDKLEDLAASDSSHAAAAQVMTTLAREGQANLAVYLEAVKRYDALPSVLPDDASLYDPNIAAANEVADAAAKQAVFLDGFQAKADELIRASGKSGLDKDPMMIGFRKTTRRDGPYSVVVFRGLESNYRKTAETYVLLKANHGRWRVVEGTITLDDPQAQERYNALIDAAEKSLAIAQQAEEKLTQFKQQAPKP